MGPPEYSITSLDENYIPNDMMQDQPGIKFVVVHDRKESKSHQIRKSFIYIITIPPGGMVYYIEATSSSTRVPLHRSYSESQYSVGYLR